MTEPNPFIDAAKGLQDCYITHAAVRTALDELEDTHLTRSHAILIGEPGLGKTTTLKKYRARCLSGMDTSSDPTVVTSPVLLVSMPPVLTVKNFVEQLLRELDSPIMKLNRRPGVQDLIAALVTLIKNRNVTMIMIDEFQNLLSNSRVRSSKAILETIKQIMSATDVSIVLTGTPQGWKDLQEQDDGSVAQRLAHHITLMPFAMSSAHESKRFKSYLKTLSSWLGDKGIDAACLLENEMPACLFKTTAGIPRDIASLLRLALASAHRTAAGNCLARRHFYEAFPKLRSAASSKLRTNPFQIAGGRHG